MSELKETQVEAAVREVLWRSVGDPDFRSLAERDAASAIEQVAGHSLPRGLTISFVSNQNRAQKYVNLPDPVSGADALTEEELEAIAGGLSTCGISTCGTSS